jgi:hypothetical protein
MILSWLQTDVRLALILLNPWYASGHAEPRRSPSVAPAAPGDVSGRSSHARYEHTPAAALRYVFSVI